MSHIFLCFNESVCATNKGFPSELKVVFRVSTPENSRCTGPQFNLIKFIHLHCTLPLVFSLYVWIITVEFRSPCVSYEDWISAKSWEKKVHDDIHRCSLWEKQTEVSRGLINLIPLYRALSWFLLKCCKSHRSKRFHRRNSFFLINNNTDVCFEHFKPCQHPLCVVRQMLLSVVRQTNVI